MKPIAWILFSTFIYTSVATALEIDAKLDCRILGLSGSKRTVLINKGQEDGLAEGDHAKFSDDEEIIARGVVIKVSPSRSVWSFYRFYKEDKVVNNLAINLKIASATKLTPDETQNLGGFTKDIIEKSEQQEAPKEGTEKKLETHFRQFELIGKTDSRVDYSRLEDAGHAVKHDADIDFSALDGAKDQEFASQKIDYSNLK